MRAKKIEKKTKKIKTNMSNYYWHSSLDNLGKQNNRKNKKEISSQQTDFRTQFLQ